jgi:hypothetical protein
MRRDYFGIRREVGVNNCKETLGDNTAISAAKWESECLL